MSPTSCWEADKMLDVYIHDYLIKRNFHASAKAFQAEGKVSTDPVAIDAPGGFLFEWWSVFWDIFISRSNKKHSDAASAYMETQVIQAQELQQLQHQKPQQNEQMLMQQLLLQKHAQQQKQQQQQRKERSHLLRGGRSEPLPRQNPPTANALSTKMYEDRLKLPLQIDSYDDVATKASLGDNMSQLLDSSHASLLKATALGVQPPRQTLHGTPRGSQQFQSHSQPPSMSSLDLQSEMNPMMTPRAAGHDGSLTGLHGANQAGGNVTLKGWPLTGLDQIRSGFLQQQKSLLQSSPPFTPLQLHHHLMLQAQQNMASPSVNELEARKLRMLLNNRTMGLEKDNCVGEVLTNAGSALQISCPISPRGDTDMLIKSQQPQQYPFSSSQQSLYSTHQLKQQDRTIGPGSMTVDGGMTNNTFQVNDQALKNQTGRKRKQPMSSCPTNSSGNANSAGPSPASPSSPSTHTPGDAISRPTLKHNGGSCKSLLYYGFDGLGSLSSAPNKLGDADNLAEVGSFDDNVESYLSPDDADPIDASRCAEVNKGFTFSEIQHITNGTSKVECCHFSSDGKLLATGGHDNKAVLWCTESFTVKSTLEEHGQWITDVRFSPRMSRLATSSADRTVRVWDTENSGYSLRTFMGHSSIVMSLDFHPSKEDLLCSCDSNSEIRYWSINNGSCAGVFKGGATQMRFQPRLGRILAAASENFVSLLDVETQVCRRKLQGHKSQVHAVCWDPHGEYLASVSEDSVRVWNVGSGGSKGELIHELSSTGNHYRTCVFHPSHPSLLVVGCCEKLELWNMRDNKTLTLDAHEKLISALTVSDVSGLVASSSHDMSVKIWK